jgi:mycothiol system anti-sigma-R factor
MGFGPGGLDCDEVLHDVYLYLDDETDEATRLKMKSHLNDCAPCLRRFGLEQDVKSLVARTCGGDRAPVELRQRIRVRLTEVTIEASHVEYRAD